MSLLRIYGNTDETSVFTAKAEPEVNNNGGQWPELGSPHCWQNTIYWSASLLHYWPATYKQRSAQRSTNHPCNKPTQKTFKELSQLRSVVDDQRQQIRTQVEQIKILNLKQAQQEAENKKVQLNTLIISGLNEENPKEEFVETTKNKLNIELKTSPWRSGNGNSRRHANGPEMAKTESPKGKPRGKPQLRKWRNHSLSSNSTTYGKKRELYSARGGLRGTDVFMSEDISVKQRALFYQCRQLRKKREIKQTWTQDLVVYILTHDGEKIVVNSDADLAPWTEPTPQANKDVIPACPTQQRTAPQHTVQEPPARTLWTYGQREGIGLKRPGQDGRLDERGSQ